MLTRDQGTDDLGEGRVCHREESAKRRNRQSAGAAYALVGVVSLLILAGGCRRDRGAVRQATERKEFAAALDRFVSYRLEPARVAPPSVSRVGALVSDGPVQGVARLVLAEDQPWNGWEGDGVRLMNNTVAHWFQIDVETVDGSPLRWDPSRTVLELNEPGNLLKVARSQEELLEELLFFAYQQERFLLDGDLVERARGGGQLRAAYLDLHDDHLQGLIAFPITLNAETVSFLGQGGPPADYHVVSMRLSLGIDTPEGPRRLQWLFE